MHFNHTSSFCRNCGENIAKEIAFCRNCGTALSEEQIRINIKNERGNTSLHIPIQDENTPVPKRIVGAILLGLLEFLFVASIFTLSLIVSMSFFPSSGERASGSVFTYWVIMATTCIAGLLGISFFSKKLREKYPQTVEKIETTLCLNKRKSVL